jgi:hypothetical protein
MISAIGELVGALAVVLSLLYVGRQVHQANAMARSALGHELTSDLNHWAMAVAASPELSEVMGKVHFHEFRRDEATDAERVRVGYAFIGLIGQLHLAFTQTRDGVISVQELEELYAPRSALMSVPYLRDIWPILGPGYSKEFAAWFEDRYLQPPSSDP